MRIWIRVLVLFVEKAMRAVPQNAHGSGHGVDRRRGDIRDLPGGDVRIPSTRELEKRNVPQVTEVVVLQAARFQKRAKAGHGADL